MRWLEIMYRLSVEDEIHADDPINCHLGNLFTEDDRPKGTESLKQLIMGSTPSYTDPIISRRALGSCFHVIQDSYAMGHCQRKLINPENMLPKVDRTSLFRKVVHWFAPTVPPVEPDLSEFIHSSATSSPNIFSVLFPKGAPGRFCYIQNFHCYDGQSEDGHKHYDDVPNREELDPSDLSSFDCLNGARDAIDKCTQLAQFWKNKTRWDDGVHDFLDKVFMIQDATDSDTNIDGHLK
ncbi:hypothetical protein IL306_012968 [Fusarium sp. DS 682]|nr:hypothetical protein IL306_012968 [Fusarium sp. DS 682]